MATIQNRAHQIKETRQRGNRCACPLNQQSQANRQRHAIKRPTPEVAGILSLECLPFSSIYVYIHDMYICICIHTCMHTYIHTYIHTCIHTYIHACMHTYIHEHIHAYIHSYVIRCIYSYVNADKSTYIYIERERE